MRRWRNKGRNGGDNIPTPNKGESEKDFISRCIPIVINEGTTKDTKQATAICYSIWRRSKEKKSSNINRDRVMLHLSANLHCFYDLEQKEYPVSIDKCTMLVGDSFFNGVFFPVEELEKAYQSWDKVPINLNHSDNNVEDIVGYVDSPYFDGNSIKATPVFDENTVKYNVAMGYIKSRLNAGRIPNVSVGVWLDRVEEKMDDGEIRLTARNIEADHLALVVHGACNPNDGCGIGLSDNSKVTIPSEDYVEKKELYDKLKKEILIERIKEVKLKNG